MRPLPSLHAVADLELVYIQFDVKRKWRGKKSELCPCNAHTRRMRLMLWLLVSPEGALNLPTVEPDL
jgi:hypothetical protein